MIAPAKSPLLRQFFRRHVRRRLARQFQTVWGAGLPVLAQAAAQGPVVVVSNHTAWWDGLVVLHLCESVLGVDGYALMDADNLRRYPFFARLGAVGVTRDDPRDGARATRWAARRLDGPGRLLWIFPQGAERSVEAPLQFAPGAAGVARAAEAQVVPVGLRYHHGAFERPEAYVAVGPVLAPASDREAAVDAQAAAVGAALARIGRAVDAGAPPDEGFVPLVGGHPHPGGDLGSRWLSRLLPLPRGGR